MSISFIESERLLLKPVSKDHCTLDYVSWLNDQESMMYMESGFYPTTLESLAKYIESIDHSKQLFLAIHEKEGGKHIGNIKLYNFVSPHLRADYGILIGDKTSWGKGYAKEASIALINHAFKKMNIHRIYLGVLDGNDAAIHLYKKLGFIQEGTLRKDRFCDGKFVDCLIFGLLKEEWKF